MKTNEVQEIVNKFKELYPVYPLLHLIPTNVEGLYFISNLVKELDIIYKEDPSKYIQYFDIWGTNYALFSYTNKTYTRRNRKIRKNSTLFQKSMH